MKTKILRIWLVHESFNDASTAREGVARYIVNLVKSLLEHSDIKIEIWCLSATHNTIKGIFSDAFDDQQMMSKIRYISYSEMRITAMMNTQNEEHGILLIPLCNMQYYQGITLKNKVLILMDLFTIVFYDLFKIIHKNIDSEIKFVLDSIENLRKDGCFFVANSQSIIDSHILKHTNVTRDTCDFVYLPVPTSNGNILKKEELFTKFNIDSEYIIFPTQVRPHKNIEVLLKLLVLLKKSNIKLKLLLTGALESFPPNYEFAIANNIMEDVICVGYISSLELRSFYHYASMCIAPSLEEGGMPWPIFEALEAECPVIAGDIPVTRERLSFHGLSHQTSGIPVFDPYNVDSLFECVMMMLESRESILKKQQSIKSQLFSWTWQDVATKYIGIFDNILTVNAVSQRHRSFNIISYVINFFVMSHL